VEIPFEDTLSAVWSGFASFCEHSGPSKLAPFSPGMAFTPDPFLSQKGGTYMLRWALIFFLVALVAAVFGFTGIAAAAAGVAKVLFFLFVVLFLLTLLGHVARRP
jgi:uncharacterized membrane protein YtjA (UPF0391 family)